MKKIWIVIVIFVVIIALMGALIANNHSKNENSSDTQNSINNEVQANNIVTNQIEKNEVNKMDTILIKVNDKVLKVRLENNSSVDAFIQKLKEGNIIVSAHDYGDFEKVGDLGFRLPTNDIKITTQPGDLILYQGNQISLYYDTNTWTFTRLGKVEDVSKQELRNLLGSGSVTLTFSLEK